MPDLQLNDEELQYFLTVSHIAYEIVMDLLAPLYIRTAYHTSALSGAEWVHELLTGHPKRIQNELGVNRSTFLALVEAIQAPEIGLKSSRHVSIEEQLSIFLYTVVTGLSCTHVGERFQRSSDTISKYFRRVLQALATPPFYTAHVHLPNADSPTPPEIEASPKFYPFFDGVLGAIDGTHIPCTPSATDRQVTRNRKGTFTQNCLAACSFDLRFTYFLSGWEGSTADSTLFNDARRTDFYIPNGKYYLADAGFALSDALLVPYRGVRYHLSEWGSNKDAPRNAQELFNLRHASARNVIERIFGILKRRFRILQLPPEYKMDVQAMIPPALAALHNFIRECDPDDIHAYDDDDELDLQMDYPENVGGLGTGLVTPNERARANARRDRIATEMWEQYQRHLEGRAAHDG